MKIWNGYASEHSSNLVMIGHFKEVRDAAEAKRLLNKLEDIVQNSPDNYVYDPAPKDRRFTKEMMDLVAEERFWLTSPADLGQLLLDVTVRQDGNKITVTTDEIDVSIFLKVMIRHGARVEVYSGHDYSNIGISD